MRSIDPEESRVDGDDDARAVLRSPTPESADRGADREWAVFPGSSLHVVVSEVRHRAEIGIERGDDTILVTLSQVREMPGRPVTVGQATDLSLDRKSTRRTPVTWPSRM